jgi:iron(II)-dependent oxidoreductase
MRVAVPAGRATLGARPGEIPFGWDNEFPSVIVDVPAFEIDIHNVTNLYATFRCVRSNE